MKKISRKDFLLLSAGGLIGATQKTSYGDIMTVSGKISSEQMGKALVHEHFLVDFIGADRISYQRWNRSSVARKVLPYLTEVKQYGIQTILDCTPAWLGRDVELLTMLVDESGLQILTNTGYYGAVNNKYLPQHAFTETAEQLADRWIHEFENGIEGTKVKPGFIKIGVNEGPLSLLHQKLIRAAGITHLATGLTICSHTGPAEAALEQIGILKEHGVDPSAFVWVHAQAEKNNSYHQQAADMNSWISLDGIGWGDFDKYADTIEYLKKSGLLHRLLISHDAGWFKPDEPYAPFTGYTNIFTQLSPLLQKRGISETDIFQLLVTNPMQAFTLTKRKI
jgi:phosphotriesterase-related protein